MKSKRKPKRKRPTTDREALWGTDLLTDAHNDRVCKQLAEKNHHRAETFGKPRRD